tara:strand:- start:379 stop:642 length:264 start_codon:yes stop_codon:yes gene_type:complete
MEPPEVRPQIMDLLLVLVMQTQIILLVVLGELNMLAVAALVGALDFLAQEMEDMVLVVVALADKILIKPQVQVELGTWWYTQELHRK